LTSGETGVEFGKTPWGNDFDVGFESIVGQFETDLVVTFAGTAVGDGFAAFFFGDFDLATGNYGAGERGSEKIDALLLVIAFSKDYLVDSIALNSREDQFFDKLLAKVLFVNCVALT
jgi:hypothetical protein